MKNIFSEGFGGATGRSSEKKFKGVAGVTIIMLSVLFIFFFLFIVGIASNYAKHTSLLDPTGIGAFFLAMQETVSEFIVITNTIIWTMAFFIVQGVFLFVYYKVARFIWVHLPIYQKWLSRAKEFLSR